MAETTSTGWREVRLPADLCAAAEGLLKDSGFTSLEDLLAFVLRQLTARDTTRFEQQERELIEQRLRDLGYL